MKKAADDVARDTSVLGEPLVSIDFRGILIRQFWTRPNERDRRHWLAAPWVRQRVGIIPAAFVD